MKKILTAFGKFIVKPFSWFLIVFTIFIMAIWILGFMAMFEKDRLKKEAIKKELAK